MGFRGSPGVSAAVQVLGMSTFQRLQECFMTVPGGFSGVSKTLYVSSRVFRSIPWNFC